MSEQLKQKAGTTEPVDTKTETIGRYVLYAPIARGGMATVHIARLVGAEGFSRIVAAKRLHEQYTEDQDFVTMFMDEARIASKLHHPNVVSVLDVVLHGKEVVLVQEYVHGVPLDKLVKVSETSGKVIPVAIAVAIVSGILLGLHSAHETRDELGEPLNIVHRDVSPQNVIVSTDGIPRLLDFGIAKARSSAHVTTEGFFKGKIAYIPPEQLRGEATDRTTDVYAAGVVLWELLVGRRMHTGRGEAELFSAVLSGIFSSILEALAEQRATISPERWALLEKLSPVVMGALAQTPAQRYATGEAMAEALRRVVPPAPPNEISVWVNELGGDFLKGRQRVITANEESWRRLPPPPSSVPSVTSGVQLLPEASQVRMSAHAPAPIEAVHPSQDAKPMKRYWLIALLVFLLCGALFGWSRAGRTPEVVAEPAPRPSTTTPALPTIQPAAAIPAPSAAEPPAPAAMTSTPAAAKIPTTPRAPAWTPPHQPVHASPPPPATNATPPPPANAPPNCNPPYYFEGTKKIFKPGCL
jgi:serine/threonine protein kinase